MDFQEVIDGRCSVRSFAPKKVSKTILKSLIMDATKAPSACNRQPWIFYIVQSTKERNAVAQILKKTLIPHNDQIIKKSTKSQKIVYNFYDDMGGAPNIIFIYRKKNKNEGSWVYPNDLQSIACACENLMLSAVEKGLGTCWIGSFKEPNSEKALAKLLGIKKNEELIASLLVGYPAKDFKVLKRSKKKMDEVLTFV